MSVTNPTNILLTTDFSESAAIAYPYALGLARRHGASVTLLHIMTLYTEYLAEDGLVPQEYEMAMMKETESRLAELEIGPTDGIDLRRVTIPSAAAPAGIIDFANTHKPDMIVMSTHGRRLLAQLILGSVARRVIAAALCPVLCVKRDEAGMLDPKTREISIRRVLVPVDLSGESRRGLELGIEIAAAHGAEIHVLYVIQYAIPPVLYDPPVLRIDAESHRRISTRLDEFVAEGNARGVDVKVTIEEGNPAPRIADYSERQKIDLILVGRKGFGETPHFLGGVTERLLHDAHNPMLVL